MLTKKILSFTLALCILLSCSEQDRHSPKDQLNTTTDQKDHTQQSVNWFDPETSYQFSSISAEDTSKRITFTVTYDSNGVATVSKDVSQIGGNTESGVYAFTDPDNISYSDSNQEFTLSELDEDWGYYAIKFDVDEEIIYHQINDDDEPTFSVYCWCTGGLLSNCTGEDCGAAYSINPQNPSIGNFQCVPNCCTGVCIAFVQGGLPYDHGMLLQANGINLD